MIDIPLDLTLVRGVAELERTPRGLRPHRLPAAVRERFPDPQLLTVEAQPAGARIALRTTASRVELDLHPTRLAFVGLDRPRGHVDVHVDGGEHASIELAGGDLLEIDPSRGERTLHAGAPHPLVIDDLPTGDKLVELWLPHNESVDLVALRADAPIAPDDRARPIWLHHGSSISHGSNAVRPSRTWPVIAAGAADVELRNLGLGGSAMADPFLARVMRDTPADLISVKLGINIVNADAMRRRALVPAVHGFLDTIREGHPETPLLLVSPIFCGIHEDTPGPGALDPASFASGSARYLASGQPGDTTLGRLTLGVIRDALRKVIDHRRDDPHLHHLEGTDLYGEQDAAELPLPDGLHPSPEAHELIGRRFADRAFARGRPFAVQ